MSSTVLKLSQSYPVITLAGPRQAGKSTLAKMLFPKKPYVSLEDLDQRSFAQQDPRGFLQKYSEGAIIDEVQRCPDLLSYIQTVVDQKKQAGLFILTGSAQLNLLSSISQSLAGRTAVFNLLPFSLIELKNAGVAPLCLEELLYQGSYPPIYDRNINSTDWCNDYIQTYIERDVRQILNVQNLGTFQIFLKLCAGRVGQLLNLSSLANDCGISYKTAEQWINVLESTFILFRLPPHFKNFSKRLVKAPKLYFYDTGLLCTLLGIQNRNQIESHASRGAIFESWVISELYKGYLNRHRVPGLFFWRDHKGLEVDVLIEHVGKLLPVEIKSGKTIASDWFNSLKIWNELAGGEAEKAWLIYAGSERQARSLGEVLPWNQIEDLLNHTCN